MDSRTLPRSSSSDCYICLVGSHRCISFHLRFFSRLTSSPGFDTQIFEKSSIFNFVAFFVPMDHLVCLEAR